MERRPGLALAAVCLATLAITVDTTIVNVTLPSLVRQLGADVRDLQWIVDGYNLTFAALVLAAGSLGDRYGRRGALVAGLSVFAVASAIGSQADSTAALVLARVVMGVGAAFVFPATLSIISNVFTDRTERAKAIGLWGATGGLGVALGPICGGWLLDHFWWGTSFLAMVPVAGIALVAALMAVPPSRDPSTPPLDVPGLVLSTLAVAVLVATIIEAPAAGWTSTRTVLGAAVSGVLGVLLVRRELRTPHPMLDVSLFRNLRFSAASGAVTVAFFALFGFIFLVSQYFQFVRGYDALGTGVRQLPVALAVAVGSTVGVRLAMRLGNDKVVSGGLLLLSVGFAWASQMDADTSYLQIALQMVLIGLGMAFTSAPATEAIMGVVPPEKAGIGSAVNDATRELGGTLGVAVIGSVFAWLYAAQVDAVEGVGRLSGGLLDTARGSLGGALSVVAGLQSGGDADLAGALQRGAHDGFFDGLAVGCLVAAGVALAGSVFAALVLPGRPDAKEEEEMDETDVLIVGGGFAGVSAAIAAARVAEGRLRITVVNGDEWLVLRPRLYETDLSGVRVSLPEVLEPLGVELVYGRVERIDTAAQTAYVDGRAPLRYGRLVLAAGSRLRRPSFGVPVHDVDTYAAAIAMQADVAAVAADGSRPLDERFGVVVVGAGLAGLETATELAGTVASLARSAGFEGAGRVVLVDPAADVASLLGAAPADAVTEALSATGVELVLGRLVVDVTERGVRLDDGTKVAGGTVVWTAGLEPSPLAADVSGRHDRLGRVAVDDFLRAPDRDAVFVAGDVAAAAVDEERTTVMSCQHAIPTGKVAGRNAAASLLGLELEPFAADPYVTCVDLGAWGGLLTTGWERTPVATGADGKRIKREILDMIHPARWDQPVAGQSRA